MDVEKGSKPKEKEMEGAEVMGAFTRKPLLQRSPPRQRSGSWGGERATTKPTDLHSAKRRREEEETISPEKLVAQNEKSTEEPKTTLEGLYGAILRLVKEASCCNSLPGPVKAAIKEVGSLAVELQRQPPRPEVGKPAVDRESQTEDRVAGHFPRGLHVVSVEEGAQISFQVRKATSQDTERELPTEEYPALPPQEGGWITQGPHRTRKPALAANPKKLATKPKANPSAMTLEPTAKERNGEEKQPQIRSRPVSLLVKAEGVSYAELLRTVKKEVNPAACGASIAAIRQTKGGSMAITFRGGAVGARSLRDAIASKLPSTSSKLTGHSSVVHIRDLDGDTTEEDVLVAIKGALKGHDLVGEVKVTSVRPAHSGTQRATAVLPKTLATKLLAMQHLRIGWVECRVKLREEGPVQCFKCWSTGHIAADCKGVDRAKLCFNCGSADHRAVECQSPPFCPVCNQPGHRAGATRSCKAHAADVSKQTNV